MTAECMCEHQALTSIVWMFRKRKMRPDAARKTKMRAYLEKFRYMVTSFCLP